MSAIYDTVKQVLVNSRYLSNTAKRENAELIASLREFGFPELDNQETVDAFTKPEYILSEDTNLSALIHAIACLSTIYNLGEMFPIFRIACLKVVSKINPILYLFWKLHRGEFMECLVGTNESMLKWLIDDCGLNCNFITVINLSIIQKCASNKPLVKFFIKGHVKCDDSLYKPTMFVDEIFKEYASHNDVEMMRYLYKKHFKASIERSKEDRSFSGEFENELFKPKIFNYRPSAGTFNGALKNAISFNAFEALMWLYKNYDYRTEDLRNAGKIAAQCNLKVLKMSYKKCKELFDNEDTLIQLTAAAVTGANIANIKYMMKIIRRQRGRDSNSYRTALSYIYNNRSRNLTFDMILMREMKRAGGANYRQH